ncbi:MAG: hypothetical protein VB138_10700 [Burkholderia sp.]
MARYCYSGPPTGITIGNEEFMLHTGSEIDLPDCAEVETLLALKRLAILPPAEAGATTVKPVAPPQSLPAAQPAQPAPQSSASTDAAPAKTKGEMI